MGRETFLDSSTSSDLPQPARVVMHLAEPYLDKGRHLFTDRFYSSIPLALALESRNTSFTGTLVKNRVDLPDEIRWHLHLKQGEVVAFRYNSMLALAWRAETKKNPVLMLSTEGSASMVDVPRRRSRQPPQPKPVVVHTYNQHMNGVDIADQHSVYYSFLRKTIKWWRKMFFWLIETSVVNSFIMYKIVLSPSKPNHLAYRRTVVESYASRYISAAPPRRRLSCPHGQDQPDPERLNGRLHLLGKSSSLHDCCL